MDILIKENIEHLESGENLEPEPENPKKQAPVSQEEPMEVASEQDRVQEMDHDQGP